MLHNQKMNNLLFAIYRGSVEISQLETAEGDLSSLLDVVDEQLSCQYGKSPGICSRMESRK